MKDIYSVLRQKEIELERVGRELKALLITASLLTEEDSPESVAQPAPMLPGTPQHPRTRELDELAVYYPFAERLRNSDK